LSFICSAPCPRRNKNSEAAANMTESAKLTARNLQNASPNIAA